MLQRPHRFAWRGLWIMSIIALFTAWLVGVPSVSFASDYDNAVWRYIDTREQLRVWIGPVSYDSVSKSHINIR
jgi:hypothetical protein